MPVTLATLQEQSTLLRSMCIKIAESEAARGDVIPAGWNNNIRWHIGHLITTPRVLTFDLFKEELGMPAGYRAWFGKGSSPKDWGGAAIPALEELAEELLASTAEVFKAMAGREEEPFPQPYKTSVGVILHTPIEALAFSQGHDGIHLGMLMALARAVRVQG